MPEIAGSSGDKFAAFFAAPGQLGSHPVAKSVVIVPRRDNWNSMQASVAMNLSSVACRAAIGVKFAMCIPFNPALPDLGAQRLDGARDVAADSSGPDDPTDAHR